MATVTGPREQTTAPGAVEWSQLRHAILKGQMGDLVKLLSPTPPSQLKHLTGELRTLYRETQAEMRSATGGLNWISKMRRRSDQIVAAAIMCEQTPARVAWWLKRRGAFDPKGFGWPDLRIVIDLLAPRREPAWLAELTARLAGDLTTPTRRWQLFELVQRLDAVSGAQVPLTDGFVLAWLDKNPDLRAEPRVREFAARIFEVPDTGEYLSSWTRLADTLAELTAEGALDRDEMLDGCVARLLRGGGASRELRGFHRLYDLLAPAPDEVAARLQTYLGMVAAGDGGTVKRAQTALKAVDALKPLGAATLRELATTVLARPEASIATAQLGWIDRAIRRDPSAAPELLGTLTTAFGHPAVAVQQRALRMAARHLVDDALRSRLRKAAAGLLDPALAAEAHAVFGAGADETEEFAAVHAAEALAQPVYRQTPNPAPIASVEELVEAFAPAFASVDIDLAHTERIMEAVTRFAHLDRSAIAAFAPLPARFRAVEDDRQPWSGPLLNDALRALFRAAFSARPIPRAFVHELGDPQGRTIKSILLRIYELADAIAAGRPIPCLLATPTESSGAIDPQVFLERVSEYRSCDARPLRRDLEQALLRLPPDPDPAIRAALSETAPSTTRPPPSNVLPDFAEFSLDGPKREIPDEAYRRPMVLAERRAAQVAAKADGAADPTIDHVHNSLQPLGEWAIWQVPIAEWSLLLPFHPDVVAAHAMEMLYRQAKDSRGATVFPRLAETAGVPGHVTHIALAYGMSARTTESRIAAVDAALILAARGMIDAATLGSHMGQMLRRGLIKASRIVASLDDVARGGAPGDVLAAVARAVAELADAPETRGLPDLLLLAARYAGQAAGSPVAFPRLDELAALARPARVAQEARRLSAVLDELSRQCQ